MYGASIEVPHGCGRTGNYQRGERSFFPGFLFRMSAGDSQDRDPGPRGRGRRGPRHGGGRRGRRARRGDIRQAILLLLAEEPRNGYRLMQEVEERSGGIWRPSPGSVYPALSQLEDEGLVSATEQDGRKAFTLTEGGIAHVEANREKMGIPWETVREGASSELDELRLASRALAMAAKQVAQTGSAEQLTGARSIIDQARRNLYRILAGDPPADGESDEKA